jgi:hypothetical protein
MGDWGIKISREGIDTSSTDPKDMVLHSGYKTLKAQARATTTAVLLTGNTTVTKSIAHGLGYAPYFWISVELNSGKWYTIGSIQFLDSDSAPGNYFTVRASSDATNINLTIDTVSAYGSNQTYNVTYYAIVDQLP